ncbi:MAG TPA: serine/threonine-protein kinase, partial [Archangium sp.]|uniref:serine/threonine-protein kinase n=1 Tax=Archangium sp. TaxID=1872627 RepID=UPI002E2F42B4
MRQAEGGGTDGARQARAQRLQRQLLRRLLKEGAQEEFLPREGETVGTLVLKTKVGAGSYGTVYRAVRDGTEYAVKLLYLPRAGEWALRELEVLLRLHHVGLMVVDSHGHHGEHPGFGPLFLYIVTAYVPGLPLDTYVERHNPTARGVADVVLKLAEQLVVAHDVGVVHRDIKCDNVVVTGEGRPVLVDYGVGTFPGALTVTRGQLPGAIRYRAPEAWRFRRERQPGQEYVASARDDLWALGVLFYWLLTGVWPFDGAREEEVEDAVLSTRPVPPHERNPRVPPGLSAVCMRMLEAAPEARYADAEAVCAALEAVGAGADAAWEVPLCEAWSPESATTRMDEVLDVEQALARDRRLLVYEREHPRRGKPGDVPELVPVSPPAVAATAGERAPTVPKAKVFLLGGGVMALALATNLFPPPPVPPSRSFLVQRGLEEGFKHLLMVLERQEVAPPWCPLEGGDGAAPAWAATPAPVAPAMLPQDTTRVKTSRKDSPSQQQKQGPVRSAMAHTLCTAAVGALAAGCPGAQVRATPPPEACPPGALETMRLLGIRTGADAGTRFAGVVYEDFVTVQEGPGARLE